MSTIKERKVGEIFQDGNITLKTEICYSCSDCFYRSRRGSCNRIESIAGECSPQNRSDKMGVIFKKIESNKKEIMRDVILKACIPEQKLLTVKVIKETLGLGLKEAKDLVDNIPITLVRRVTDEMAGNLIKTFTKEGMKIEVRDTLTNKLVYPTSVPAFKEEDSIEEVKILKERIEAGENSVHEENPHYWIMGTPDRGDDVYDLLQDKDSLLQSKIDVSKEMLENPSRLLWINDSHEINAISVEDNVSLLNLITKNWTELKLPWMPKDKQLVWAYDDQESCRRIVAFYDIKNNCCFCSDGTRNGYEYDHYEPFEEEYPQWAKKALTTLKD